MKYLISFTLFEKEIKCTITGNSPEDAEYRLRGKLKINSVIEVDKERKKDDAVENLMNIFGMK